MKRVAVALTTLLLSLAFILPFATSANAATWRWCSSDAQGTWQPNFGRWFIQNNAWNGSHGPQRTCANSYHYWRSFSKQPRGNLAVMTYPNSSYSFGRAFGLPDVHFNQFRAINSRYSVVVPYGPGLSYNAAYDVWYGRDWEHLTAELMIWFNTRNVTIYDKRIGTAHIYGQIFKVYRAPGNPPEYIFRLDHNVTSGTAHIQAITQWLVDQHYLSATTGIVSIPLGFEIRSTNGQTRTFGVNRMDIYTQRK